METLKFNIIITHLLEPQCIDTLFLLLCTFVHQGSKINLIMVREEEWVRILLRGNLNLYFVCIFKMAWNFLIIFCHADHNINTAQKMKFSIKDFFSKCDQILRKLWVWSHLLEKSLMENFIFSAVAIETF